MDKSEIFVGLLNDIKEYEKINLNSFHGYITVTKKNVKSIENNEIDNKLVSYFMNIFKNISTNSVMIVQGTNNDDSITIGNYGIGIRENKQARPVRSIYQISELNKRREEVIKGLNNVRKWKKAEDFALFMDIFDEYQKLDRYYTLKLPETIKVIKVDTWNEFNITRIDADIIIYTPINNDISISDSNGDNITCINYRNSNISDVNSLAQSLNYMALDKYHDLIKDHIKKSLINNRDMCKVILDKLESNFGKYFMVNEL